MSDITERLRAALAALNGWNLDRCEPADDGETAEIGGSFNDGDFAPLVKVDATLYYPPDHSMSIARALSTLATSAQEALDTIEALRAEVERLNALRRDLQSEIVLLKERCARSGIEARRAEAERLKRRPLTDEQIRDIVREAGRGSALLRDGNTSLRIARAIERAHGITGD